MRKSVVYPFSAILAASFAAMVYAAGGQAATEAGKPAAAATGELQKPAAAKTSVLDRPVDFSTPDKVRESLQAVRDQAGNAAANELKNAMQYLLTYDLSVGRNQDKLYKKLNGRTPRQIIAKMSPGVASPK